MLNEQEGIIHVFGTCWNGATLLKGPVQQENAEEALCSLQETASILGIPSDGIILGTQVHGDDILVVEGILPTLKSGDQPVCDGLVTDRPQVPLAVRTADCAPLIIFDPCRRVIGIIHAGWKGTALDIAGKAAGIFTKRFSSDPSALVAVIGPTIGSCCYEVGSEVFSAMEPYPWRDQVFSPEQPDGKRYFDIGAALQHQLLDCDFSRDNITALALCTACRDDLFYSWRRQKALASRQISAVMLL